MRNLIKLTAAATAGCVLVTAAHANAMKHDADGDGVLSMDEYADFRAKRYAKFDANGDGEITRAEWLEKKSGGNAEKAFDRTDEDGDGIITQAEVQKRIKREFKRKDGDGDGVLSASEA